MLVIAHRGANKEEFENSWQAFEKAIECGSDRIELDVQMTKDGHGIILHDDSLYHATGQKIFCSTLTRSELSRVQLRNGSKIPFLDEVIENLLPRVELNIEIKNASTAAADLVGRLVSQRSDRDRVVISSFDAAPLRYLRENFSNLRLACLWGDDRMPWPFFSNFQPLNFMNDIGAKIFHPRMDLVTEKVMDQARARGWQVYTWAPMVGEDRDRESWWVTLKSLGVDGHCTNYPREFRSWLESLENYQTRVKELLEHGISKRT